MKQDSEKNEEGCTVSRYWCTVCNKPADDDVIFANSCYIACSKCGVKHWYESSSDTHYMFLDMPYEEQEKQRAKYNLYRDV